MTNSEGYSDPTAEGALSKICREEEQEIRKTRRVRFRRSWQGGKKHGLSFAESGKRDRGDGGQRLQKQPDPVKTASGRPARCRT